MTQAFPAESVEQHPCRVASRRLGIRAEWAADAARRFLPHCSNPRNMRGFRPISAKIMTTALAGVAEHSSRCSVEEPSHSSGNAYPPAAQGLYDPAHEHDACGLG